MLWFRVDVHFLLFNLVLSSKVESIQSALCQGNVRNLRTLTKLDDGRIISLKSYLKEDSPAKVGPKYALKMLLIGDAGVGKTDLMCSVADGVLIDSLRSSIGSSFGSQRLVLEPLCVHLQIWNLTAKPHFDELRQEFYLGSAGAIYVFNVADRTSFKHISEWVKEVHKILGPIPAILVGNRKERGKRRQVTRKEGEALAKDLGILYVETSAKTSSLLNEVLQNLVFAILKDRYAEWISDKA